MYYPDLSPCIDILAERFRLRSWENYDRNLPALRVGWLDIEHPYTKGEVPLGFVEALIEVCRHPVARYKGFHCCSFCAAEPVEWTVGKTMFLGSCDIEVVGEEAVYFAPALILHYVADHGYLPSQGFIDAVLAEKMPEIIGEGVNVGRVRVGEDDPHQILWRWPVEKKPDEAGRFEHVLLYRNEFEALLHHCEYKRAGRCSRYGVVDLGEWIDGKVPPEIGEIGLTTPHNVFPRLQSVFYVQAFLTEEEQSHHFNRICDDISEAMWIRREGNKEFLSMLEARLTALRKEVEELV